MDYDKIRQLDNGDFWVQADQRIGVFSVEGKPLVFLNRHKNIQEAGKLYLVETSTGLFQAIDTRILYPAEYVKGLVAFNHILLTKDDGISVLINASGKLALMGTNIRVLSDEAAVGKIDARHYTFHHTATGRQLNSGAYDHIVYLQTAGLC